MTSILDLYRMMARIRAFEDGCRSVFARRTGPGARGEVTVAEEMPGFLHLYRGEEAIAVGVCSALGEGDSVASTHRGHGHMIARGADVNRMMAELYGRSDGYSRGKGGSMHMFAPELGIIGTNGIVGGGLPHAVGAAFAHQQLGRDRVAVAFFGDGAANQGVFFESMNLASLWHLPVIFVCENNTYAEWTESVRLAAGSSIADRAVPFGIPAVEVDGNDVLAVRDVALAAVGRARHGRGPTLIEAHTHYFGGHFEGEEVFSGNYRSDIDIDAWRARDPITRLEQQLLGAGLAQPGDLEAIDEEERSGVEGAFRFALESPPPALSALVRDVYVEESSDAA